MKKNDVQHLINRTRSALKENYIECGAIEKELDKCERLLDSYYIKDKDYYYILGKCDLIVHLMNKKCIIERED